MDDLEQANIRIAELEATIADMNRRLEDGTLHVGCCNDDHSKRVGSDGMICNCTLGQEIKGLRLRLKQFEGE